MSNPKPLSNRPDSGPASSAVARDPRWQILDLVIATREDLRLNGSDIAALRGMIFLLPAAGWGRQMVVHASNQLLASRADGMNERTLRRAIERLSRAGLLRRQDSPNRKRYRLRSAALGGTVCFGLDLAPLLAARPELERLAAARAAQAAESRSVKTLIRHSLFLLESHSVAMPEAIAQTMATARAALRRKLDLDALQELHRALQAELPRDATLTVSENSGREAVATAQSSAKDSQIVRHIQKSKTENRKETAQTAPSIPATDRLELQHCLDAIPEATSFAATPPESWEDLDRLATDLAPGLGIDRETLAVARGDLGPLGYMLAILGMVQSFGRITNPTGYLARLVGEKRGQGLDLRRMFRSLTRPRPMLACIPG